MNFHYYHIVINQTDPLVVQGQISLVEAEKTQLEAEVAHVSAQPDTYKVKTPTGYITKADWLINSQKVLTDMETHISALQKRL